MTSRSQRPTATNASSAAKLGAWQIIQRAVEDEFDAFLGRARNERRPHDQREERSEQSGLRNGFRARKLQTGEGELEVEIPQVRRRRRSRRSCSLGRRSCCGPSR